MGIEKVRLYFKSAGKVYVTNQSNTILTALGQSNFSLQPCMDFNLSTYCIKPTKPISPVELYLKLISPGQQVYFAALNERGVQEAFSLETNPFLLICSSETNMASY